MIRLVIVERVDLDSARRIASISAALRQTLTMAMAYVPTAYVAVLRFERVRFGIFSSTG